MNYTSKVIYMKKLIIVLFLLNLNISFAFKSDSTSTNSDSLHFKFEPDSLVLNVGDSAVVKISIFNRDEPSNNPFYVYGLDRGSLKTTPRMSGGEHSVNVKINAVKSGDLTLNVRSITVNRPDRKYDKIKITVPFPEIDRIEMNVPKTLFSGTTLILKPKVIDKAGILREDIVVKLKTNNKKIATIDDFGNLHLYKDGNLAITATADDIQSKLKLKILKNPINNIELSSSKKLVKTGDVVNFNVKAFDSNKKLIDNVPISFSYNGRIHFSRTPEIPYGKDFAKVNVLGDEYRFDAVDYGLPASAEISQDGKFVAETPGVYTIYATTGGVSSYTSINVLPRNIQSDLELVGIGLVPDYFTSDLWVWPGIGEHEGKDFAVTGTWSGDGHAYFWDVTDPSNIICIDTVKVDARTVNDVKISSDGKIGVITREGASNRKNGFVILDVVDPFNVKIHYEYDDDMTGGVHNAFIYENHVYSVNNGRKFDIINIDDPKNPKRVGVYELNTAGHHIHDVWVIDGIAYSSNWLDGVHAIDIGGPNLGEIDNSSINNHPLLSLSGKGSPSNPIPIASLSDPSKRNHAAFPFLSKSTGKFFIIGGDEKFPAGNIGAPNIEPSHPSGGFHFINFDDPSNPVEEAIYQVPEAGTHNFWIQGDTLIAAYYQAGLRILDISGELMGDLYKQGREIASFYSGHIDGKVAWSPMAWGAMPYKDLIFFSDMNSGLYAVKYKSEDDDEDK